MNPLLSIENISKGFSSAGRRVAALDNVSLTIAAGETLGLVGASGSGKSTLSRLLLRLLSCDAGTIRFEGEDWLTLKGAALRRRRARMQMVFQDPLAAFNPLANVGSVLEDPLRIHGVVSKDRRAGEIAMLLERVGLPADYARRPIRALSGGQRQRVAIARAIATRPSLLVLDEAVSALDVTVRGRILELLVALQKEHGIACLFISHDLAMVRAVSHRIAVMDGGRIVETGPAAAVVAAPQSEAARALVAAVPRLMTDPS
ncbi:oligopeptide ABC transporter ATP binding protein (plasmid) [Rhizobium phaseoli]|uniref:ABC transporter ATP-binding protein n=1 Tax=Rhizobium phaseoli TaxID=396 RepID=UPI0007E9446C|nr:dipeptide/oligopeptide/nickel ABC transporter ATP-binding protein [Rhizobium phaseoli]ANL31228.1 oligopeptide ABC transporter ATP binding protein [Rhizobium phaseoli]ANL44481.1 oligopeptide ABC transporter ATP binding protein [Rhizobium phaseoli]ANL56675.1 oligopeptide ABC transporter ATP binding protein [Rhizobium phaseoli]ANL63445.1 oligopeptide ABC transporter ATP binding protein [Rhizobium phaseoli]ANL75616.1 oligopeptide ABC transporter ATP binding protein [Rhizobium phaseoli]